MTRRKPQKRRATDKRPTTLAGWFLRYAKDLVAIGVLAGMVAAGGAHFATAADVDKKFRSVQKSIAEGTRKTRIEISRSEKGRIEDKLIELRSEPNQRRMQPMIRHYESKLQDINERLRKLELEGDK